MIDLHAHTFHSDGALVPAELIRRAAMAGYRCLALTDHADATNLEQVVNAAVAAAASVRPYWDIRVVPGAELTHNPPDLLPELIREARRMGALIVVVHGETLVEPVPEGTNEQAVAGGADILAHPGLLTEATARRAARAGVALEITTRKGHSLANGHVAAAALRAGAPLVINTDTHDPGDLTPRPEAERIALGAGLRPAQVRKIFRYAEKLSNKLLRTKR